MPSFGALEKSAALGEGEETKLEVLPKSDFTTQVNEIECLVYMRTQARLPFKGKTGLKEAFLKNFLKEKVAIWNSSFN